MGSAEQTSSGVYDKPWNASWLYTRTWSPEARTKPVFFLGSAEIPAHRKEERFEFVQLTRECNECAEVELRISFVSQILIPKHIGVVVLESFGCLERGEYVDDIVCLEHIDSVYESEESRVAVRVREWMMDAPMGALLIVSFVRFANDESSDATSSIVPRMTSRFISRTFVSV
jgi:hypothetical protein